MSESGAVGSWQARTYVGLPITSSGFEAAADVRGLSHHKAAVYPRESWSEFLVMMIMMMNVCIITVFFFKLANFFNAHKSE